MNINLMRNAVILGQVATITAQIEVWQVYEDRTDVDTSAIRTALQAHITALMLLITP